MDPALESLKEVIVLLRSSEIGNSGAISAKLPPSRFECDCFQIAADLPSLAQFGAVFKAVLKAPQCCGERCLVLKTTLPHTIPAGLRLPESSSCPSEGSAAKKQWLGSRAGDNCGGQEGKAQAEQGERLDRNGSNNWRYQGMAIELRLQDMERVTRWSQKKQG